MTSILKNTVEKNIKEPTLRSTFNKIERLILDSYCSTEYHLNNWLIENKLLLNVYQITISHSSGIYYNKRVTKRACLPLRHKFKLFFENGNNFKPIYKRL